MNMFSMKPKFDLAAFLAVPAPVGAARSQGARRRGMQFQPSTSSTTTADTAPAPETPETPDTKA